MATRLVYDAVTKKMKNEEYTPPPIVLDDVKADTIAVIKDRARSVILTRFSLEKQKSISDDSDYARLAISGLMSMLSDQVVGAAVSKVGLTDDVSELQVIEASIPTMDITDLTAAAPEPYVGLIDGYYRDIIESIVVYRLIRIVRNWSNAKEAEVLAKTTLEEIHAVNLNDFPLI